MKRAQPTKEQLDATRVNPNPRLERFIDYALDEVVPRLHPEERYSDWIAWAREWKDGQRQPQACVDIARQCFAHKDDLIFPCLGQLAWGAKEACYSTRQAGWYVLRYIADAMIAFGIAYPNDVYEALEHLPDIGLPK